ncbi:MAG: 3-hydroxyacyl-CoA dehydrogenase family protein [Bacteroidota bacterium]
MPKKNHLSAFIVGDDSLVAEYSDIAAASNYVIISPDKINSLKPIAGKISIAVELSNLDLDRKKRNLAAMDKALPETTAILSSSVVWSVLDQAQWVAMKHRLVGIAALPTLISNSVVEVSPSIYTNESAVDVARRFFASVKKDIAIVQDRVGMVMPRILCQIINEAMFAVQQDVAAPKDLDTAMKLGMNFPSGPLEWGEKIGFKHVYAVLDAVYADLGEERYRICPLLKEIAVTGKFWG